MAFEQQGSRIDDLKVIVQRVAFAATLFDADGISMRFMNTDLSHLRGPNGQPLQDGVATEQQVEQIMQGVKYKGLTPMGTALKQKVIDGIVMQKAAQGQLRKPILVITVTDGQPAGEAQNAIFDTIKGAVNAFRTQFRNYGTGAIAFAFAQVGDDKQARAFLGSLDEDPEVGPMIDCTSGTLIPR